MKSPISHAPLIRRRVMTEPDAGPSNEEPDVMTTTAEVHPARIVAEIRANDGRQPGPREAEDGEDAPRDSGADGDESPSSPSPTLAPLADDERSSGGSLGDDEDDDIDDIRPESDSPDFEFPGTSTPAASSSRKTGEKLGSLEHLTVLAANATNELANLRRELNAERTRVAQYSTELRMLRRSTKEMGETAHAKAKLATDAIEHALKARDAAESTLAQMKNEVEAARVANELVRAAEDRAIAAEARANDAENRAAEADAIAEKALEVSFFSFSYGQLV